MDILSILLLTLLLLPSISSIIINIEEKNDILTVISAFTFIIIFTLVTITIFNSSKDLKIEKYDQIEQIVNSKKDKG